jgi:hypothetical protein
VKRSGLTQTDDGYIDTVFEYPDEATMLRAQRAVPMAVQAERRAGEMAVTEAIASSLARYRTASGGYRIGMEWRYVAATVSGWLPLVLGWDTSSVRVASASASKRSEREAWVPLPGQADVASRR